MKIIVGTFAGIVLASSVAVAGGNPDENDFGVGTREPLQQAQPLRAPIPDQYQIQREAEAEVRKGWVEMNLSAPADNDAVNAEPVKPITIARKDEGFDWGDCGSFFSWLPVECDTSEFSDHNPSPVGHSTIEGYRDVTTVDTKTKTFNSRKAARKFTRKTNKGKNRFGRRGYTAVRNGKVVTLTKTTVTQVQTFTKVRNDKLDGGYDSGTADDSNGMRGDNRDSGNW